MPRLTAETDSRLVKCIGGTSLQRLHPLIATPQAQAHVHKIFGLHFWIVGGRVGNGRCVVHLHIQSI